MGTLTMDRGRVAPFGGVAEPLRRKTGRKNAPVPETIAAILTGGMEDGRDDLGRFAGTWVHDPATEAALAAMDTVDAESWK